MKVCIVSSCTCNGVALEFVVKAFESMEKLGIVVDAMKNAVEGT